MPQQKKEDSMGRNNQSPARQTTLNSFLGLQDTAASNTKQPKTVKMSKRKREDTPSVFAFFKRQKTTKRKKALEEIHTTQEAAKKPLIVISYRPDRDGKGALYDHRAIQVMSQQATAIVREEKTKISKFQRKVCDVTFNFTYGKHDDYYARTMPPLIEESGELPGLLIIPGVSSTEYKSAEYQARKQFEFNLIEKAKNTGQPIMGICGGSWVIWEYYGGSITSVVDHSFRSGMPRLLDTGKVGNNKQIHRIKLQEDAFLLKAALNYDKQNPVLFPVNSVHSYAADHSTLPATFQISALAKQDDELAPLSAHSKTKEKMKPTEDAVEAFESIHGAPILGVQWHPEAYTNTADETQYPKNQQHLLHYMAKAGETFKNRQLLNAEFNEHYESVRKNLKKTNLIAPNNSVVCKKTASSIYFTLFKLKDTGSLRHVDEATQEIQIKENYLGSKGYKIT